MCDLATAALVLAGAGGVASMLGGVQSSQQAAAETEFRAQVARNNQVIAQQQAASELVRERVGRVGEGL